MKIIIYSISIFIAFSSTSFSQSVMNFQNGTAVEVQAGADICADQININGTFSGSGTICGGPVYLLNLTLIIQGFYNSSLDVMVPDTLTVYLRNSFFPFAIADSAKSMLNFTGSGSFLFFNAINGTNYYLVTKHRNSLETWSSSTQLFAGNSLTYDFTPAVTQAFGNNMKQVDFSPVRFGIYSGDVNQDGIVDASDISLVDNDALNALSGYEPSDLNGDDFVDASDLEIVDNNAFNAVSVISP